MTSSSELSCFWLRTPAFCLSDECNCFFGIWGALVSRQRVVIDEFWYSLIFLLFGYRHWQQSFAFVTHETTAAKSSYLYDKHISSCLGPYWLLTCETFLRVPHAAVQTSVPASDPAFFIRFAGPDAFLLSRERVFVMTDFILVYFISDCVNLFCSREYRIREGWWVGGVIILASGTPCRVNSFVT